ncbi:MAG: 16S rRNA (cytosine(967)-C(5))-methyltransferase RsmB [Enterococcus sp.]
MGKIPNRIKKSVRFAALTAIERISKGGAYSNLLLNEMINKSTLNDKDARLLTELVYGTISHKMLLEFYLAPFIKDAKKVDEWVKSLLILSIYQFEFLDKVPAHAVVNEAVEIAKAKGNPGTGKFVNGVLRTIQRKGLPSTERIQDKIERLSIEVSIPTWLIERLVDQIGYENTKLLGESLYKPSHVSGRIDTNVTTREEAIAALSEEEIDATESLVSPYGIVADKGHLAASQLFNYGLLTIQDESSMLVAPTMQIEPNHQVLDACAAPGGKTTHIATFLEDEVGGQVTALDIHAHKVELIKENAERLHVASVVQPKQMDARTVAENFAPESFDRILVDAPCSGLGLMRRKPDIKYRKKPEDLTQLPQIQLAILESCAPTLKSSGIMTYSTCTILKEENQEVIATFLAKHPEFEKIDVQTNEKVKEVMHDQMLTLYPHQFHTDGFFICCLRKK